MDSAQPVLKNKLDSLTTLQFLTNKVQFANRIIQLVSIKKQIGRTRTSPQLQASKITRVLDSINNLRDSTAARLNAKLQALKDKTIGELKDLDLPPQLKDRKSQVSTNVEGFQIPSSDLNISSLNLGNGVGKLNNLYVQSPIQHLGNIGGLDNVKGEVGGNQRYR